MYIVLNNIIQKPLFHCAPQSRRMKLTLQNEKRLAMLTELLKLCKYFVLYYPFPNIIIIIQHNNWQISIFGLYFFCYPVLSRGVLIALWEKIFTDKFGRITSPSDT